jgi:transcriptional regulator with XRE-family HTH domain
MMMVQRWSGQDARALREALRMTVRDFASFLGVSDRTVSKWEAGGAAVYPRPDSQAILDTALGQSPPEVVERFAAMIRLPRLDHAPAAPGLTVISHKFIPLFVGAEAASAVAAGPGFTVERHGWLECASTEMEHPDAQRHVLHVFACGVAMFHLVQRRESASLAQFAAWRYRSYEEDRLYAERRLAEVLGPADGALPVAEYVLSAYWLEHGPWDGGDLDTALRLLCASSALVDREAPDGPQPLDEKVEMSLLMSRLDRPDVVPFGVSGVSIGYAGWSGVSYLAEAPARALREDEIADCELVVQALWCFSRRVQLMIEEGHDPSMPEPYGWRFLRAADSRLTTARALETSQHCLMREAILSTSGLPAMLRAAQEALREGH